MNGLFEIEKAIDQIPTDSDFPLAELFKHGTLSVEYYAPSGSDRQNTHKQDEIYVIAKGRANFYRDGETRDVKTGDLLFVPAGMEHRFSDISDEFGTWVIFYGPDGGEKQG